MRAPGESSGTVALETAMGATHADLVMAPFIGVNH